MMSFTLEPVENKTQAIEFIELPVRLYAHEKNWIRPLDKDVETVFSSEKNTAFKEGECIRWLLRDEQKKVVGRVAAFVEHKKASRRNEQPTGGMGFFECIENQQAAFILFDACKQWLQARGMEAMDGPINFGNRDKWWGLLIDGFHLPPNYQCQYHFPYYQKFFEAYGFHVYFYQLTFGRPIEGGFEDRLNQKAALAFEDTRYRFDYVRKKDWHLLPELIRKVYNEAWANRTEIQPLSSHQAKHLVNQMKPILDEKLLWFGYYQDEAIAFFLSIPEMNQIFKHVNGKLNLLGKLLAGWQIWRKTNTKACGILFGIVPAHQGKGVDGAIIERFRQMAHQPGFPYQTIELNWIGDFNPRMIRTVEQIKASVVKRHATYRKLFDESKSFTRMPILHK